MDVFSPVDVRDNSWLVAAVSDEVQRDDENKVGD
jgi:hypothetical protein